MTEASSSVGSVRAWVTIVRLGLVQAAIASVTVLPISTIPRLMVEELAFVAVAPGVLIGIHYAVQASRLRFGHGSDRTARRTPWILGGLLALAASGVATALATALMTVNPLAGFVAALLAYAGVGIGVGAAGTTLFALLSTTVEPKRRGPAATIVFLTMIAGLVLTSKLAGGALEPFTFARLVVVSAQVALCALVVGALAVAGIERTAPPRPAAEPPAPRLALALREIWREDTVRRFTVFVFISMFAYNMQELVMEPFSAAVFGLSPGESTRLSGDHHAGVLVGLILSAIVGRLMKGRPGALVIVTVVGCLASCAALITLALAAFQAPDWPLQPTILAFGLANGLFAGSAIAAMFSLATTGTARREGTRMGVWGAAQAFGFGLGMFTGAAALDIARTSLADPAAFASVFLIEAALFCVAAAVAVRASRPSPAGLTAAAA